MDVNSLFKISIAGDDDPSTGIQIHSLALVRRNSSITELYDTLIASIQRNIRLVHAGATDFHRSLNTFVFHPQETGHFVSFVYPELAQDDGKFENDIKLNFLFFKCTFLFADAEQIEQRKRNHATLNLINICLRRANNYNFDAFDSKYLINPHIGLKSTGWFFEHFI